MSTTSCPPSRKCSAMRVAVNAACLRTTGGWSEVAMTTTERARPSGPRSSSRNSRTSRPRSPTREMTETSASVPWAIIDSSEDLPTPEPANRPMRWPRPTVTRVSSTRTPSSRGVSTRRRSRAEGAWPETGTRAVARTGPLPSMGRPTPSSTRPSRPAPTGTDSGPPVECTGAPTRSPSRLPSGMQRATPSSTATTSAPTMRPPSRVTSTRSPTATGRPMTSRDSPTTERTVPIRRGRAAVRTALHVGETVSITAGPSRRWRGRRRRRTRRVPVRRARASGRSSGARRRSRPPAR